jgi:5-methylcytosine-specific restriction endonuclease McrA
LIERSKDWRDGNTEKVVLYKRHYRKAEPLKHSVWDATKRAKRLKRFPTWLTEEDKQSISKVYEEAKQLSMNTCISYQVDHIVPLNGKKVSGLHVPWNLQILTAEENNRKNNKYENLFTQA